MMSTSGRKRAKVVERQISTPLHQQLSEQMLRWIEDGTWPPNFKLPIEPELAERLNVSRGTLRKAVATLAESRHLARVHGRGTFVLPPDLEEPLAQELLGIGDLFDRQGITHQTRVVSLELVAAPQHVREPLQLADAKAKVFRLERVQSVGTYPVAVLHNYVDPRRVPTLRDHDFARERLFAALESDLGQPIDTAHRTFQAVLATRELAEPLDTLEHAPLLYLEQTTYLADATPIEHSDVWLRGDRMKISAQLKRSQIDNHSY